MVQQQPLTGAVLLLPEMQPANEWSSPVLPVVGASTVGRRLQALALSSPIPAPSVPPPPPTRSSWARPPGRVIPEQSRDVPQTAASLPSDADFWNMPVRKPIIYSFPLSILPSVTVELLLTSTWSFSAAYPPPQTSIPSDERQTSQSLAWAIAAEPGGTLVDKATSTEVSYLYWESM